MESGLALPASVSSLCPGGHGRSRLREAGRDPPQDHLSLSALISLSYYVEGWWGRCRTVEGTGRRGGWSLAKWINWHFRLPPPIPPCHVLISSSPPSLPAISIFLLSVLTCLFSRQVCSICSFLVWSFLGKVRSRLRYDTCREEKKE